MAQRYQPEIRKGDKRLIVLDGRPLGGVLRVPRDPTKPAATSTSAAAS